MTEQSVEFKGPHFLSARGREDLSFYRMSKDIPDITDRTAPIELLARVPSEECGCPEELWRIDGLLILMHFEADGSSELFLDAGDWELETRIDAASLADLRAKAFQWFADVTATESMPGPLL